MIRQAEKEALGYIEMLNELTCEVYVAQAPSDTTVVRVQSK